MIELMIIGVLKKLNTRLIYMGPLKISIQSYMNLTDDQKILAAPLS